MTDSGEIQPQTTIRKGLRFRGPFLTRGLLALGGILLVLGLCSFHFLRHFTTGNLSIADMDMVQAARYLARTGHVGTQIIRPLLAGRLEPFSDGAIPDLSHPPLFLYLAAAVIRVLHHTAVGQGDRDTVLVTTLFFAVSIGGCFLLAKRLFSVGRGSALIGLPLIAILFYAFGTTGLVAAVHPTSVTLAGVIFTALVLLFHSLDKPSAHEPDLSGRRLVAGACVAGVLYGLLFLSLYSSLLILPVLLLYLWRLSRRQFGPPAVFIVMALIITMPQLYHNWRLTGFPFYNARLYDLLANTETYPGYGIYRNAALLLPIPQYLANGGILEITKKALGNLLHLYQQVPATFGVFIVPLFLGATLTRFTDRRVNYLRTLIYGCVGVHMLGLAFFATVEESVTVLLIYGPFVCVLSAAFLLSVLRARNWPMFLHLAAVSGWTLFTILPGLIQFFVWPVSVNRDTINTNLYYYLNTDSPEMQTFHNEFTALIATDAPWDIAYRCNYPSIWLPNNTGAFQAMEERFNRPFAGILLSSKLRRDYADDADADAYITTYERLLALADIATKVDRETRQAMVKAVRVYYPPRIADAMAGFQPQPLPEDDNVRYSMLFWNRDVLDALEKAKTSNTPVKK